MFRTKKRLPNAEFLKEWARIGEQRLAKMDGAFRSPINQANIRNPLAEQLQGGRAAGRTASDDRHLRRVKRAQWIDPMPNMRPVGCCARRTKGVFIRNVNNLS